MVDVKAIMRVYVDMAKVEGVIASKTPAQVARAILTRAKKYVPVDTGTLKESGHVLNNLNHPTYGKGSQVVFNTPYAYIVHERRTAKHKKGKISKFLETAGIEIGLEHPHYALTIEIRTDRVVLYVNAPYKGAAISGSSAGMQAHAMTYTMQEQGAWDELDAMFDLE
jgi:hypothetical protein